jgi:hypothetical protein
MKSNFLVLLAGILLLPVLSNANEKGNGGKGVVCRDGSGKVLSARLLDFFEADTRGIKIDLGDATLSYQQKIGFALKRLDALDHFRSIRYTARVSDFMSDQNTKFLSGVTLESTEDSYEIAIPAGCAVEQLIVRKPPQFTEDRLWTVSQDLWNDLDDNNKAGLVLHEIVYDEVLTQPVNPQDNSINARYYNSYLSSDKFSSMKLNDYVSLVGQLGFDFVSFGNLQAQLGEIKSDGTITPSLPVFYPQSDQVHVFWVAPGSVYTFQGKSFPVIGWISFNLDGTLNGFTLSQPTSLKINGQDMILVNSVDVDETGVIISVQLAGPTPYTWLGHSTKLSGSISFYSNGVPQSFEQSSDAPASFSVYGGSIKPPEASTINLYENGALQRVWAYYDTPEKLELASDLYDFTNVSHVSFFQDGFPSDVALDKSWVILNGKQIHFDAEAHFFQDHSVKSISFVTDSIAVSAQNQSFDVNGNIGFNEDHSFGWGDFTSPGLFGSKSITFSVGGQNIAFRRDTSKDADMYVEFYPGGILKAGVLAQDATFLNPAGASFSYKSGDEVKFDQNGRVLQNAQ